MRIPRWLIIPFFIITTLYWTQDIWKENQEYSVMDMPKDLEPDRYGLEIYPVSTANGVSVYTMGVVGNHDDYLYLEPADLDDAIPPSYYVLKDSGYVLKVFGNFYFGKAIPAEYAQVKPKPERLRLFRYDSVALIRK